MELKEESRTDNRVSAITEERLTARKERRRKSGHQLLIFSWKTPSFLVGVVNEEGKDDIYKHRPRGNTKAVLVSLKGKSCRNIYPYLQVMFPDSWEEYKEDWLV